MSKRRQKHIWVIYDCRAQFQDTNDCAIHATCESEAEARRYVREMFHDGVIFVYDMNDAETEGTNERRVPDEADDVREPKRGRKAR